MFDEYVAGAVGRAKVKPITLSTPQLDLMVEHVVSGKAGSLLIAGTIKQLLFCKFPKFSFGCC
jgi:hypothetical protein